VRALGLADGDPRTLLLRTDSLGAGWWIVRADSAVADSAGNVASPLEATVAAVVAPDTVRARFRAFTGDTLGGAPPGLRVLAPGARAGIRFSHLVTRRALDEVLAVRDTSGAPLPVRLEADGSTGWTVIPDPGLPAGRIFELSLAPFPGDAADTTWTARYTAAGPDRLGELSGVVDPADGPAVVELAPAGTAGAPVRRVRADTTGRFVFDRLPGGRRYRLRVVRDLDGDTRWSPGSVHPFSPSEPLGWLDTLPALRSRWETALPDTVRIGTPPDRVPPAPGS